MLDPSPPMSRLGSGNALLGLANGVEGDCDDEDGDAEEGDAAVLLRTIDFAARVSRRRGQLVSVSVAVAKRAVGGVRLSGELESGLSRMASRRSGRGLPSAWSCTEVAL
jgi:hypothetical protein